MNNLIECSIKCDKKIQKLQDLIVQQENENVNDIQIIMTNIFNDGFVNIFNHFKLMKEISEIIIDENYHFEINCNSEYMSRNQHKQLCDDYEIEFGNLFCFHRFIPKTNKHFLIMFYKSGEMYYEE
jgi:hypothetical protein